MRHLALWLAAWRILVPGWSWAHGELHDQIQQATRLIEKEPANAALYLQRGELHRAHQDWDAAQADYDRALTLDPKLTMLHLARGRMFLEAGWLHSARVALDRFLARHHTHAEGLTLRARTLARLGQPAGATRDYSAAIAHSQNPGPELYLERAETLTAAGEAHLAEALRGLEEGLRRLGPLVVLQLYALDVEVKQKRFDAALTRLAQVAARSPRQETWLARRGEILQQAGRLDEARQAYEAALEAIAALPPAQRQVPAMMELDKRLRAALASVTAPTPAVEPNPTQKTKPD